MANNIYYVYIDKTDDGRVFYVGKGQESRVKHKDRNDHWKAIVNKHGWSLNNREIIFATKDHKYALEIEMYYVCLYKTFENAWEDGSGWGANHTAGGDGTTGFVSGMKDKNHSEEAKRKISESKLGDKHPFFGKSQPESTLEKWRDGRRSGENNTSAQLKEFQVLEIIEKYIGGNYTQKELAIEYNVSKSCLMHILSGDGWNHLKNDETIKLLREQGRKGQNKIPIEDAKNIREMYKSKKYTYSQLGAIFNIHKSSVCRVINNFSNEEQIETN